VCPTNPERAPAVVETRVRPKRATVLLDGVPVGEARDYDGRWDRLWVEPGGHRIEFQAPGHRTLRLWLDTPAGSWSVVEERLQEGEGLDPRSTDRPPEEVTEEGSLARGLLRLDVRPADAAIYLDGELLGSAGELARLHGALSVARGRHRLDVVCPGYTSTTREVDVDGAEPLRVTVELARAE
jgi:hypothetical protein